MLKRLLFVAVLFIIPNTVFAQTDPIVTESTTNSTVTTTTDSTSKILSPPPSAISPSINGSNSDLCTTGVSASVQTQILGFSGGGTVTDLNCERLKLSKTLYDMGMKVAAVSTLCQDQRVFDAMMMAGTPCPIDGKIGDEAKEAWSEIENPSTTKEVQTNAIEPNAKSNFVIFGAIALLLSGLALAG